MNNKFFKVYTRIRSLREDHDLTQKKNCDNFKYVTNWLFKI